MFRALVPVRRLRFFRVSGSGLVSESFLRLRVLRV